MFFGIFVKLHGIVCHGIVYSIPCNVSSYPMTTIQLINWTSGCGDMHSKIITSCFEIGQRPCPEVHAVNWPIKITKGTSSGQLVHLTRLKVELGLLQSADIGFANPNPPPPPPPNNANTNLFISPSSCVMAGKWGTFDKNGNDEIRIPTKTTNPLYRWMKRRRKRFISVAPSKYSPALSNRRVVQCHRGNNYCRSGARIQ